MNDIYLSLPLESDYLTTVRLTVGGVCAMAGFDIDRTEDVKVCVTESLLLFQRNGYLRAQLRFDFKGGLNAVVSGEGERLPKQESPEDEISYALLDALSDEALFRKEGDSLLEITLKNGN